jgi:hypothetical protein
VDDDVQLPPSGTAGDDVEILAVPGDADDGRAGEFGQWGIDGLECGERQHVQAVDRVAHQPCAEVGGERVDFGQFGHDSSFRHGDPTA